MATLLPGFIGLGDVLNNRLTDDQMPAVGTAVQQALAAYNENVSAMMRTFVGAPTTKFKFKYRSTLPTAYLQAKDHIGRTRGVKGQAEYEVGLPIFEAGGSIGWDRRARIKSTFQDLNDRLSILFDADRRWLKYNMFAALFAATDFTFEDEEHGTLTVKPIANGDSQVYNLLPGSETGTTADHIEAQTDTIADETNPFPNIYDKLSSRPENGEGDVISFIPTNLVSAVRGLDTFIEKEDPDIRQGANTATLIGSLDSPLPGEVLGKSDRVWLVEWKSLPSNYVLSMHTGSEKPLAMREDESPELRGFFAEGEREDFPYTERYFMRRAGFGVLNRLGAHVLRVGNGTYAVPTNFGRMEVIG